MKRIVTLTLVLAVLLGVSNHLIGCICTLSIGCKMGRGV